MIQYIKQFVTEGDIDAKSPDHLRPGRNRSWPGRNQQRRLPRRHAVLVGCNYTTNTQPSLRLHGCVNDVTRMRDMLLKRFGFSEANIEMLIDTDPASKQPNKNNIKKALQNMIRGASSEDVLLFYYSGYGSRIPYHGNVARYDECIVSCDMRPIPEKFFRDQLNKLPAGASLTIISDSRHSGELIGKEREQSGSKQTARSTSKQGTVRRFIEANALKKHKQPDNTKVLVDVDPDKGILLSGCRSEEVSVDVQLNGDVSNAFGAFSKALQQVLGEHSGPISNKALIEKARKILSRQGYEQHPCLYCSDHNADAIFLHQPQDSQPRKSKFQSFKLCCCPQ